MDVPGDLIERMQRKDPEAYTEFLERFGRRLLSFGVRMCGDREDAREVVQDTLLKTFESVQDLKDRQAFTGWLYRIAANACLMRRRQSKFLKEEISLDEAMPARGGAGADLPWKGLPEEAAMSAEFRQKLRAAVLRLPEGYKSVLVLRDMEGLDTDETAQALGLSRDVVKMRLHRARAKLRNELEAYMAARPPLPE